VVGTAVVVSRSADGGLTWSAPAVVSAATGNDRYEKNWTACDNWPSSPFYGNCHTTWDDVSERDKLLVSTSTDGGVTWSLKTPRPGLARQRAALAGLARTKFSSTSVSIPVE
jgi:Neuraminidase (sialidase)